MNTKVEVNKMKAVMIKQQLKNYTIISNNSNNDN